MMASHHHPPSTTSGATQQRHGESENKRKYNYLLAFWLTHAEQQPRS
jgi:hypothetical protein